jgi:hypothetical protein
MKAIVPPSFGCNQACAGVSLAATSFLYKPGKVTAEIIAHRLTAAFGRSTVTVHETDFLQRLAKDQIRKTIHVRSQALANNTRPLRLYTGTTKVMSDHKKQEGDFTPQVDELLPEASSLAKVCCISLVENTPNISWSVW